MHAIICYICHLLCYNFYFFGNGLYIYLRAPLCNYMFTHMVQSVDTPHTSSHCTSASLLSLSFVPAILAVHRLFKSPWYSGGGSGRGRREWHKRVHSSYNYEQIRQHRNWPCLWFCEQYHCKLCLLQQRPSFQFSARHSG